MDESTALTRIEGRQHLLQSCRRDRLSGAKPVSGRCLSGRRQQVGIPEDFVLVVSYDKYNAPCRIIWRSDSRI
jgi:hypothetical protein